MKNQKKLMIGLGVGASLLVLGLGWLVYSEYGAIDLARANIAQLRANIDSSRKLLSTTPQVEKEVIVLRETETAIKEILPDDKDIYNFHRDLERFCEDSEVSITSIKKKDNLSNRRGQQETFDKVVYELTLEGDAFQLLAFLDRVEGHARFMRIPTMNLSASTKKAIEDNGRAAHKLKVEVETFVYKPQGGPDPIKIEAYPRKRELLLGEIARRRDAISVEHFPYRGQRARRDPWVDARVPAASEVPGTLTIQEQTEIVDELATRMRAVNKLWDGVRTPDISIVEKMEKRADLEHQLTELEEQSRNVVNAGQITYTMAQARLAREVLEPVAAVRNRLIAEEDPGGPSRDAMRQVFETMDRHIAAGHPRLALDAYSTIEPTLPATLHDPVRKSLADSLKGKAEEARILLDFDGIKIEVSGFAIQDGKPPVAIINNRAVSEGDLVDENLLIKAIRPGEIEFVFRGIILVRRF